MISNMYLTFERTDSTKIIQFFLFTLFFCSVIFYNHIFPFHLWVFAIVSVCGFCYGCFNFSRKWAKYGGKVFEKKLLRTSILLRLAVTFSIYAFYMLKFECYYGPADASTDVTWYVPTAMDGAQMLLKGENPLTVWQDWGVQFSDTGYMAYLSLVYLLTGQVSDVVIPLAMKALWGGLTCVLVYRIANRHFSPDVAKLAAIFSMFCPNLLWWCSSMMKETEMVFLSTLFLEQADSMLMDRRFPIWKIITLLFVGFALFMFRTVLGAVCFLSLFFALTFTSQRVVNWGKRIIIGLLAVSMVSVTMFDRLSEEINAVTSVDTRKQQKENMEWRTRREHGNEFARYAGAAVFAPLIFSIPFPTLSYTYESQELIMENAGGNYVKNVTSFWVIICMFILLFSGEWRNHTLPLAFMLGYLVVLVLSQYAQSGRFHLPVIPLEMMFAAYGYSLMKHGVPITKGIGNRGAYRRWFGYFLFFELGVCVVWQYFKLKGQGIL